MWVQDVSNICKSAITKQYSDAEIKSTIPGDEGRIHYWS